MLKEVIAKLPVALIYSALFLISLGLFSIFIYPGGAIDLGGHLYGRNDRVREENLLRNDSHYDFQPILGSVIVTHRDGWFSVPTEDNTDPKEVGRETVVFGTAFADSPVVQLSIAGIEVGGASREVHDIGVVVENLTPRSFDIVVYGGDGLRVGNTLVNFAAYPSNQVQIDRQYSGRFAD